MYTNWSLSFTITWYHITLYYNNWIIFIFTFIYIYIYICIFIFICATRQVPTYRLYNRYNREFWIADRSQQVLMHVCGMTHSCAWHDSFKCVTWLIGIWHDPLRWVTWLIAMCALTRWYTWHDSDNSGWLIAPNRCSFVCVPRLIEMCDTTHWDAWHDSLTCVTWLSDMCDMTHSYIWHDSESSALPIAPNRSNFLPVTNSIIYISRTPRIPWTIYHQLDNLNINSIVEISAIICPKKNLQLDHLKVTNMIVGVCALSCGLLISPLTCVCVTWLVRLCSYVLGLWLWLQISPVTCVCTTWLVPSCSYVFGLWLWWPRKYVTWLTCSCDVAHLYVWRDSYMCD